MTLEEQLIHARANKKRCEGDLRKKKKSVKLAMLDFLGYMDWAVEEEIIMDKLLYEKEFRKDAIRIVPTKISPRGG